MLKIFGACLVILTTSWIGFQKARRYVERPKQIRQLRSSLALLRTDIGYGTRSLVLACEEVGMRMEEPVSSLYRSCQKHLVQLEGCSTYECFKRAIKEEWSKTVLQDGEKMIMLSFARTLGVSNKEDQLQHLDLADENLKIEEEKAREEQQQYEKMYRTVGVLCGALIVILIY